MKTFTTSVPKQYNIVGIYLLKIHSYYYVGSSLNVKKRINDHRSNLKTNRHENRFMQNVYTKYGIASASYALLEICDNATKLEREKYWIDTLNPQLNLIRDPCTQFNSTTQSKIVYQFTLDNRYIGMWISASEVERQLNINGNAIARCCRKCVNKSAGGYLWSYTKTIDTPYTNNSKYAKIKAVTMYNKFGIRLIRFSSIIEAAKHIATANENLNSLSATIASAAKNNNYCVNDKYLFSYEDKANVVYTGSRNFPIVQIKNNGEIIQWNSIKEIVKQLSVKQYQIIHSIRHNKCFMESRWSHFSARVKQDELLETPKALQTTT
jgi:group I intron endonuclease